MLRFGLFALLAILLPGVALQRLARVRVDPALVVPLGTAFCSGAYAAASICGLGWIFPAAVTACLIGLALTGRPRLAAGPSWRAALAPGLAIVALLALTQYSGNRVDAAGRFLLDPFVAFDTSFHVGLARELANGYPPQLPGVSGFPVAYHLGTDLVRAAGLRWAGVDPYDSVSRFDVTLFALALVLALRGLAATIGAARLAVDLAPWTLLATDFSFIFAANPQAHWWCDLLRGNILVSLALANPVVPALALTLGSLIALARYDSGQGRGWLALAGVQALAVPAFKVFLGAHLLLGLGVAALLRPRLRGPAVVVALPCLASTAALALGAGSETVSIHLAPLDLVAVTRQTLSLPPASGAALLGWATLWLAASLGLRMAGLRPAIEALRRGSFAAVALAAMALAAWPLGLLLRVSAPEMLEGQRFVNDAAYLVEQGGPLLWIFATLALARWLSAGHRFRALRVLAVGLLCAPATVQFAVKKATLPQDPVPAGMVRAMRALAARSAPLDVVLQRPGARYPPLPVVLIGRRVPYDRFTPYLTQFASPEALERRHEAVYRFFHTREREEAVGIARALGATYLCLYGNDRVRFDASGLLDPVHEEPDARCYRLSLAQSSSTTSG